MAGKWLLSQVTLLAIMVAILFSDGVTCSGHHQEILHMCNALDESSEECSNLAHYPKANTGAAGPLTATNFDVKYFLYNGRQEEQAFTYDSYNTSDVKYALNAPWKVLIHGFLNSGTTTFPMNVRKAYLERMIKHSDEQYNVLVFDWGDGACASVSNIFAPYRNAAENVEAAGKKLGDMLVKLETLGALNITGNVHLIGHSLGSHVAGQAARRIREKLGKIVWRISALDPAGPLFWRDKLFIGPNKPYPRLRRSAAKFLDVYHTSKMFGSNEEMGDVDFFVNGGEHQSSCDIELKLPIIGITIPIPVFRTFLQVCSHNYATEIFAKSINDKTMKACTGCYSYDEYERKKCECEDNPVMGQFVNEETIDGYPIASGVAYIQTPRDTTVGSNYLQMLRNNGIFNLLWKGWQALCF